jgi:hypothetical protein
MESANLLLESCPVNFKRIVVRGLQHLLPASLLWTRVRGPRWGAGGDSTRFSPGGPSVHDTRP